MTATATEVRIPLQEYEYTEETLYGTNTANTHNPTVSSAQENLMAEAIIAMEAVTVVDEVEYSLVTMSTVEEALQQASGTSREGGTDKMTLKGSSRQRDSSTRVEQYLGWSRG